MGVGIIVGVGRALGDIDIIGIFVGVGIMLGAELGVIRGELVGANATEQDIVANAPVLS